MMTNAVREYPLETTWQHKRRIRRMCTRSCRTGGGVVHDEGLLKMALLTVSMWAAIAVMFVRLWV